MHPIIERDMMQTLVTDLHRQAAPLACRLQVGHSSAEERGACSITAKRY
jgi:hypothetical protein